MTKPMTLVFDIDGTVCDHQAGQSIIDAQPYKDRIALINQLHDAGNRIIYFTARGMSHNNPDDDDINKKIKKITKKQLDEWGAKYDDLIFGKPEADAYIDNRGINASDFFSAFQNKMEENRKPGV